MIDRTKKALRQRVVAKIVLVLVGGPILFSMMGCPPITDVHAVLGLIHTLWQISAEIKSDVPQSVKAGGIVGPQGVAHIAAGAHVAGTNGTNWRTDVAVHAVGDTDAVYTVELLEHGRNNSNPESRQLSLQAGRSVHLADVLENRFGFDGAAALRITPSEGRLVLTSRTYNSLGAGNPLDLPAGSTFGQFIPAVGDGAGIAFGEEARLIQLSHDPGGDDGFRTNLGLVNRTGEPVDVEVELFRADGISLGIVPVDLAPFEYQQVNRIMERVTTEIVTDAFAVVRTTTPGGSFLAYASVVDNRTGDPVAMMADEAPPASDPEPLYVVAAAHVTGAAGTNWRTDLEIHNPNSRTVGFTIELLEHGRGNPSPESVSFAIPSGQSHRFDDVLDTVFSFQGAAALRITPNRDRLVVTSRTFNLLLAGNELGLPAGSTFGQSIAGELVVDGIAPGDEGILIQLAETGAFRTNLVLVSASASPMTVEIDLFNGLGDLLGTISRSLAPFEYRQLNRVFDGVTTGNVSVGYAVVRSNVGGSGTFFALASVVDNRTGDPVAIPAARLRSSSPAPPVGTVSGIFDLLGDMENEDFGFDGMAAVLVEHDIGEILDAVVDESEGPISRSGDSLIVDFGSGWEDNQGNLFMGTSTMDFSGLSVTSTRISGTVTETYDQVTVNGTGTVTDWAAMTFDLDIAGNGSVAGHLQLSGGGQLGFKSASLSGTIDIDTLICRYYPVGGSVSFTVDGETHTFTFDSDCDGEFGTGGGGEEITVNFDDLAAGTTVTNQYPPVTFSSEPGLENRAMGFSLTSQPNSLARFEASEPTSSNDTTKGDVYLDFAGTVTGLRFTAFGVGTDGDFLEARVYQGAHLAGTETFQGTGEQFDILSIDLSGYTGVTRVEFINTTEDDEVGYDDLVFVVE